MCAKKGFDTKKKKCKFCSAGMMSPAEAAAKKRKK